MLTPHFQSVYADMALTVGKYLIDRFRPDMNERLVDVSDFVVEKALIPHSQGPQLVRQSTKFDWSTKTAECKFYSVNVNKLPRYSPLELAMLTYNRIRPKRP